MAGMFKKRVSEIQDYLNLRILLAGPAGSGKSYSSILIAQGLADGQPVGVIDTERKSSLHYRHLLDFYPEYFEPPYNPTRLTAAIKEAEKEGIHILIIDGVTPFWSSEGGELDQVDKAAKGMHGNTFGAWRTVTPMHNKLVDTILNYNGHVICTARTKTAYEVQDNDKGKKAPVKIGLALIFKEGFEYEFTSCLDLAIDNHTASCSKDRTGLFDGQYFTPSIETGKKLLEYSKGSKPAGIVPLFLDKAERQAIADLCSDKKPIAPALYLLEKTGYESTSAIPKCAYAEVFAKLKGEAPAEGATA
jgi:hypothetical protein